MVLYALPPSEGACCVSGSYTLMPGDPLMSADGCNSVGFIFFLAALIGLSQLDVGPSYRRVAYGVVSIAGLGLGVQ